MTRFRDGSRHTTSSSRSRNLGLYGLVIFDTLETVQQIDETLSPRWRQFYPDSLKDTILLLSSPNSTSLFFPYGLGIILELTRPKKGRDDKSNRHDVSDHDHHYYSLPLLFVRRTQSRDGRLLQYFFRRINV